MLLQKALLCTNAFLLVLQSNIMTRAVFLDYHCIWGSYFEKLDQVMQQE